MSRSRFLSSLAAASLGVALLGACSAESLTERAVGFGLEQAIEGDQDIDLDFSDEGGGFSVSTEEGDFAINFDEDSGGIVFDTDEGSGVISLDENGIVYDTDEGEGVISFDEDNGTITFDTDEGSGQINVDEDAGTVSVTTDEGEFGIIGTNGDVPDNWPSEIGFPASLVPGSQSFTVFDMGDAGEMVTGTFAHAENDPYPGNVVAALEATGWTVNMSSNENGDTFVMLTKGDGAAQVVGDASSTSVIFRNVSGG